MTDVNKAYFNPIVSTYFLINIMTHLTKFIPRQIVLMKRPHCMTLMQRNLALASGKFHIDIEHSVAPRNVNLVYRLLDLH